MERTVPTQIQPVIDSYQTALNHLGIQGFWYQGIANNSYHDLSQPSGGGLFSLTGFKHNRGVICSSDFVHQLYNTYTAHFFRLDPNFVPALELSGPYCYQFDLQPQAAKTQRLFQQHGYSHILSWPVVIADTPHWQGRFTLLSSKAIEVQQYEQLTPLLQRMQMELLFYGRDYVNPFRQQKLFNPVSLKVLQMTADGLHNREISDQLHITIRGVEYHLESLRTKLAAKNRANLIHQAHRLELI